MAPLGAKPSTIASRSQRRLGKLHPWRGKESDKNRITFVLTISRLCASIAHMKYTRISRYLGALAGLGALAALLLVSTNARAATWKGLEPLVSRRGDVERILGPPTEDRLAKDGTLHFELPDGPVTVFFVTPRFIATRKIPPRLEGTVLLILVQHPSSRETPGSMKLRANLDFESQITGPTEIYANPKDGIYYTFVESRLRTTRYSFSDEQLKKLQDELKPKSP